MKKELAKNYDFKSVEDRLYTNWLEKKYFHAEADETKKPFTIVIPPPNVTGQLHMGHALDNTMQDILIRAKKMQGYNALWVPGCDHASISTELKIVEALAEEGKTKEDLGREGYLERAWQWKETYGGRILNQLQKIGCACDWDRERFTMDEGLSDAVLEVFVRMYDEGKIYRGEKLINWCPNCQTSISDAEVDHEEKEGSLWHLCYVIDGTQEKLCFATTRPETMLGDTALAVNPKDERYAAFVGKTVTVPVVNRKIPVIADDYVDMEFGTGIVKITPGHDPNDYEVGLRHNLPVINIMNDDGTMNENAGKYNGFTSKDCRAAIVREFDSLGLFVKKEELKHSVGVHERCGEVIEPLIRKQWFVKMAELAKPAIDVYLNKELNIVPPRFGKIYLNWLNNIKDWCISRQLWWGHRIPAYFCEKCGKITVSKTAPEKCVHCGSENLKQDEDVLDTWFSSALWPFSTLGWPKETPEMKYFYPTDVLVTGYDIIFFWVIRMVFSGLHHTGQKPFKDVLFHGIIRDAQGRKMSKSLGNGIDPLEVIEKYGADALRISLIMGTSPGNDSRFKWEKMDASRNFLNKIWNSARFILMFDSENIKGDEANLTSADKWILSKVNNLALEVTENLNNYELGLAVTKIYNFLWDEFCDWYIEMVKPRLYNEDDDTKAAAIATLKTVLTNSMKLLHPFMPFITEEVYTSVLSGESIMISQWPFYNEALKSEKEETEIELVKSAVKNIRNIRAEKNVAPSKKIEAVIVSEDAQIRDTFTRSENFFKTLANAFNLTVPEKFDICGDEYVSFVIDGAVVYLPLAGLVDIEKELQRAEKEKEKLLQEIKRAEGKLKNEGFLAKAPQKLIDEETEKLEKYKAMLEKTDEQLNALRR
ncbi:MAG: valine--tRNA ligase [Clostridiales bacterium]|jgi:valyl-tRNA synthetase|nr:valine--tRNA ligase [Clostridiales bacterium]